MPLPFRHSISQVMWAVDAQPRLVPASLMSPQARPLSSFAIVSSYPPSRFDPQHFACVRSEQQFILFAGCDGRRGGRAALGSRRRATVSRSLAHTHTRLYGLPSRPTLVHMCAHRHCSPAERITQPTSVYARTHTRASTHTRMHVCVCVYVHVYTRACMLMWKRCTGTCHILDAGSHTSL